MLVADDVFGSIRVRDTDGGVWHPSEEAHQEIESSNDREATAVRICREEPTRGQWKC